LKGYDYSQAGLYFITICCQNRICRFGDVVNGEMVLNEWGQIAFDEWIKTNEIRSNVELGEFIIMPNHIHGIIRLLGRGKSHLPSNHNQIYTHDGTGESHSPNDQNESNSPNNQGECNSPNNQNESNSPNNQGECNSPLRSPSQTIGAIVRGYKSSVTKQLGLMGLTDKLWQRNYYEHIIRNEQSHQRISNYISHNPEKWKDDVFFES
jgi:REP element-mobilizing transposase RayT